MGAELVTDVKKDELPQLILAAKPPTGAVIQALAVEDQVLLTKLLTEPVEFVDHPDFAKRSADTKFFGGPAKLVSPQGTRFVEFPDDISDTSRSGERVPTLSYDQESHIFNRYNLTRKKIADLLSKNAGKRLSAAATRELLAWGHRMLACRSVIVKINMPLVLAMAKRTRLTNIDFNEMISEGNMALLRSVEKFDAGRGYKFSTYSCRAILKSFSRVAMRASRYRGKFPTEFDPAMERSDYVESRRTNHEADCVDELKEIFLNNLAELSEVERTVITERFALGRDVDKGEDGPKTLEQVGKIVGVTKERIRQIQNNALKKMRVTLEERFLAA